MTNQTNYYKARLAAIGRSQVELASELYRRGIRISDSNLSKALRVINPTTHQNVVRELSDEIIIKWENEQKKGE